MVGGSSLKCDRTFDGVTTAPRLNTKDSSEQYQIEISGNPATYVPGEQYTSKYYCIFPVAGRESKNKNVWLVLLTIIT